MRKVRRQIKEEMTQYRPTGIDKVDWMLLE